MSPTSPTSPPAFMPDLPERVRPITIESALALHDGNLDAFFNDLNVRGGVLVSSGPDDETVVVHFAYPLTDARAEVFVLIDTITHMHRDQLEHFGLSPLSAHGVDVLAAAFVLPRALRATTSLLVETDRAADLTTDRAQWRAVYSRTRELSTRAEIVRDDSGGRASVLALPGAAPAPWTGPEATGSPIADAGVTHRYPRASRVHQHVIDSAALGQPMRVWAAVPHPAHGEPSAVIAIADGARWSSDYAIRGGLERLHDDGACSPTLALFFSPEDPARRAEVLGMNPALSAFLLDELLPWASTFTRVVADPARRAIAGASLGGLAAADVVRRRPDAFGNAVVQSGSFWWPGPDSAESPGEQLRLWRAADPSPAGRVRVFQEVGDQEGHLRDDNRAFRDLLHELGVEATYREYAGGHDYACWRVGTLDAIAALFPAAHDG